MKTKKKLIFSMLFILCITAYAQKSAKQLEREQNKIDTLYTYEEKGNLQLMFNKEVEKMRLSQTKSNEYFNIMANYGYDMSRLDDKDKGFTSEEIRVELNKIVNKLNTEVKDLLNKRQYIIHLESMNKLLYSIYSKWNWKQED